MCIEFNEIEISYYIEEIRSQDNEISHYLKMRDGVGRLYINYSLLLSKEAKTIECVERQIGS